MGGKRATLRASISLSTASRPIGAGQIRFRSDSERRGKWPAGRAGSVLQVYQARRRDWPKAWAELARRVPRRLVGWFHPQDGIQVLGCRPFALLAADDLCVPRRLAAPAETPWIPRNFGEEQNASHPSTYRPAADCRGAGRMESKCPAGGNPLRGIALPAFDYLPPRGRLAGAPIVDNRHPIAEHAGEGIGPHAGSRNRAPPAFSPAKDCENN